MTKIILRLFIIVIILSPISSNSQIKIDTSKIIKLPVRNPTVNQLIDSITKPGYGAVLFLDSVLDLNQKIHFRRKQLSIGTVLNKIASEQKIRFFINGTNITFCKLEHGNDPQSNSREEKYFIAEVVNQGGIPIEGVNIMESPTGMRAITDQQGKFRLPWSDSSRLITLTCIGYETLTIRITNQSGLQIILTRFFSAMDEMVFTGYSTTRRKSSTSNVATVWGKDLPRNSWPNPISALQGKLTGVAVTDYNGTPGTTSNVLIRGRQTLSETPGMSNLKSGEPLILLNFVPLVTANEAISNLLSAAGDPRAGGTPYGLSAIKNINIYDIEKIEVLKDADATAIYGSKGAHCVILITTRKGEKGHVKFSINFSQGGAVSSFISKFMNTSQFLGMRTEAIKATGGVPDLKNLPELAFGTTRYTNWPKYVLGNTAGQTNLYFTLQGGDKQFNFYASVGYYREGTVLPVNLTNHRGSFHLNFGYQPIRKLRTQFSLILGASRDNLLNFDPTLLIRLAPNAPSLYDSSGNFRYEYNGVPFLNIRAAMENRYSAKTTTLTTAYQMDYELSRRITFRLNTGLNTLHLTEKSLFPIAANKPITTGRMESATATHLGWIIEPQVIFADTSRKKDRTLSVTFGSTLLGQNGEWLTTKHTGYPNDAVIGQPLTDSSATPTPGGAIYRYEAVFGRINIGIKEKFFFNLTGRIDGSSRFGRNNQLAPYGAFGTAWVFADHSPSKERPWRLTHGKIRFNTGMSGSDNIGDNRFRDKWDFSKEQTYGGISTLQQTRQANPNLGWERNYKNELSFDLEWRNHLWISGCYFLNRSSNLFVALNMPTQTGLPAQYGLNHQAVIQNSGFELSLQKIFKFQNKSSLITQTVITIPKNKLVSFKDLDTSPYSNSLRKGQSVTVQSGLPYYGVHPETGLFLTGDSSSIGVIGHRDPTVYGGISSTLKIGNIEFRLDIEGRKQKLINPIYYSYLNTLPGRPNRDMLSNHPTALLHRWVNPGDQAAIQRFTTGNPPDFAKATRDAKNSALMLIDGSYLRIRSVCLSWDVPGEFRKMVKLRDCRFYIEAMNLFTITPYKGGDPTIQEPISVPSLRSIAAGININL